MNIRQGMHNRSFRLLHASDIHVGIPGSRHALERLVDFSRTEDVDVVIITGDLFDNNRVDDDALTFALKKLQTFKVPLLMLPGNHDCLVEDTVYQRNLFKSSHNATRVFTQPTGETVVLPDLDLAVWGRPLCDYGGRLHPLASIPARGKEQWQIATVHGQVIGSGAFPADSSCSFPITIEEIMDCDRDYVALGHWPVACPVAEGSITAYYAGSVTEMGTSLTVDFALWQPVDVTVHHI